MTFKHVFWEDAMEFKNLRDILRFLTITTGTILLAMIPFYLTLEKSLENASPISVLLFISLSSVFFVGISFYINTSLQGMELADEWRNGGDRDGSYWLEHFFLGTMLSFSIVLFNEFVLKQEFFCTNGLLTDSQLLIELPLVFLLFTAIVVGLTYIGFCLVMIMLEFVLYFMQKKEPFENEKRKLFLVWEMLDDTEQEQLVVKLNLLENAINYYRQLPRKQKEKGALLVKIMFKQIEIQCYELLEKKNPLK